MKEKNRASLASIAKKAGVSVITVSRALDARRSGMLKESTREKILAFAKEFHYMSNISARRFKTGKTETFSFVMPRNAFENPLYLDFSAYSGSITWQLIEGIIKEARKWNYDIKIEPLFDPEKPDDIISRLGYPYSDGVILCGIWELENIEKKIKDKDIPYITVAAGPSDRTDIPEVAADYSSGVSEALDFLIGQNKRDIALFLVNDSLKVDGSLFPALRSQMIARGCFRKELVYAVPDELKLCSVIDRFPQKLPFAAAFCSNDTMALMLIKEFHKRNIECPKDISVIGFDDNPVYQDKGLSTIAVPRKELGAECVDILVRFIEERKKFSGRKLLPTHFIKRKTC